MSILHLVHVYMQDNHVHMRVANICQIPYEYNLVFKCSYISIFLIYVSMWFLYDLFYANVHDIKLST